MRKFLVLGLFALCSLSSAAQTLAIVGGYRYVPDDAVKEHCRKHRLPLPKGELVLRDDFTFSLVVNDRDGVAKTLGTYVVENDLVRFTVEEGLGRDLPHVMRLSQRGMNGKGAAFSRIVVKVGGPGPIAAVKTVTPPPAPVVAPEPPMAAGSRIEGVWTSYRNGLEDKSIKMTFFPSGRFKFTGLGVSSAGEYAFDPGSAIFVLTYREIDGQRLEDGVNISKRILLEEEGTSFTIEKFQYRRASGR
ncbi:MAG: hypothetical protein ACO1SV_08250 [Fimbriimonas sp.]